MKTHLSHSVFVMVYVTCIIANVNSVTAQGDDQVEAKFVAMLKNATLKGTWAPVSNGKLGGDKGDDVYAGRWWENDNKEHGGTIAGTIAREP